MRWPLLLGLFAGCVPYAVPPVTGEVGALVTTENGSRTGLHVDVGFSPMQLMPSQLDRGWDATLSGSYDRQGTRDAWGAAIAGGPIFRPTVVRNPGARVRLLPQVVGRLTTDAASIGARVALEYATFSRGAGNGSSAFGEAAIGAYVESGYRSDDEWLVTAGLTMRLPAIVGLACCIH